MGPGVRGGEASLSQELQIQRLALRPRQREAEQVS